VEYGDQGVRRGQEADRKERMGSGDMKQKEGENGKKLAKGRV
jgi:hypothetical protein